MKRPSATFVGSAADPEQFPRDGLPEVAFLGRSNVGKSSLLNALLGLKDLARVSSTPGRTRLVNFFRVGSGFYLVDLPGYGYAKVPETLRRGWEQLVTSYLVGREPLVLCVFLLDSRHEPNAGDTLLKDYLDHLHLPYLIAATKTDKLGRGEITKFCARISGEWGRNAQAAIAVSAQTGLGIEEIWGRIRKAADARHQELPHGR